ncbi:class I SAM-dependent methyltransferase [Stenotrophomonas sp. ZAC14D1_NAIMI4_6]|uniref:class I SAM-dependent methyltransferase n=1 Tax=unclassified Stenotrophomonas maltophilia group TaxID=2961925 RepID=UPI000D5405B4|nr:MULTISPECIES: class I SAM-dependent methyltransferase [unclassified Stenotrophomonas maltophilia group]AWH39279.1 class I SAM-dependent methyltransferase [Stenotrophomonas sp. ZAC14D1_NAIMI4_6]AWH43412.1 class I SAM-dependent methyltransferase [Stenotrophomonas sp. ZAC14D1_NAIMI4_1]
MNTPLPAPIDHSARYRQHLLACGFQPKPASAWDARAAQSSWKRRHDDYSEAFLARLDLTGIATVLDVGCGPGLLSLPIAAQVEQVHALDYSSGMLDGLRAAIARDGVGNVTPWPLSWTDDWQAVPRCGLAIASRSLMVPDLEAALRRLDAHALQRACITFATGPRAGVTELAELLGREWVPMPDHRYPINMLLDMGREPQVDYLPESVRDVDQDADGLVRQAVDLFGVLDEDEQERVRAWHARSPQHRFGMAPTRRWAFIQWATDC